MDHPKAQQAAHAVLLCHGLLTVRSLRRGKTALLSQDAGAEKKGYDLSAFLFYPSTLLSAVLFFGLCSLTWFSFSLSLNRLEEKGK